MRRKSTSQNIDLIDGLAFNLVWIEVGVVAVRITVLTSNLGYHGSLTLSFAVVQLQEKVIKLNIVIQIANFKLITT